MVHDSYGGQAPVRFYQPHTGGLAHYSWAHLNILRLRDKNLGTGLESLKSSPLDPKFDCIGCIQGKSTICSFKGKINFENHPNIADTIYSDVWGPATVQSLQGDNYFITFTDRLPRFTFVKFTKKKSKAFDCYVQFANWMRTQKSQEVKHIHFDNGKELVNSKLKAYCHKKGTKIITTAPYSSQQNGTSE
jgi:hypothetical protein